MTKDVNKESTLRYLLGVFFIILVFSFLVYMFFSSFMFSLKAETSIINRLTSPDGKVDAIVTITDAGAVSSMPEIPYRVYLLPTGNKLNDKYEPVFVAYSVYGFEIKWLDDKKLLIKYDSKDVRKLSKQSQPLVGKPNYKVEIQTQQLKRKEQTPISFISRK